MATRGSRKPLCPPSTSDKPPPNSLVPPMSRAALLDLLRKINVTHCAPNVQVTVVESDLVHPTAERVELIYHMLLNVLFALDPASLDQMPSTIEHPELYEGFFYVVNFLRIMDRVMNACVVPAHDFGPRDLTDPTPRRTQFFFTAVVNYIKFSQYINKECHLCEHEDEIAAVSERLHEVKKSNAELEERVVQLRQQKVEEQQLEQSLLVKIDSEQKNLLELQALEEDSNKKLEDCRNEQEAAMKSLDVVKEEFYSQQSRLNELKLQVVSSPEELKENLSSINEELDEMKVVYDECLSAHNMWERLCNMAENVLPAITNVVDSVNGVIDKAHLTNDKKVLLERAEDNLLTCKQGKKECLAKQQNITKHLKLIEEEMAELTLKMRTNSNSSKHQELERDVATMKEKVEAKRLKDRNIYAQVEQKKQMLTKVQEQLLTARGEFEQTMKKLKVSYESYRREVDTIEGIMKK